MPQHSQETDIHAPVGIRTRNPNKRAAVDAHIRPCGHWDRPIYRILGKFLRSGSVLNVQKTGKRNVLAKDTLYDTGARMETNHSKTLHRLAVYSAESKSSGHSQKKF